MIITFEDWIKKHRGLKQPERIPIPQEPREQK